VITERIVRIIDNYVKTNRINELSILVTTFNKELSKYLQGWILELLDKKKIIYTKYENFGIQIEKSKIVNVIIYHFDVLPTRLWKYYSPDDYPFNKDSLQFDDYHISIANNAIKEIKLKENITTSEFNNVLNSEYVLDEYQRIIYGNNYSSEEIYLNSIRKGRPVLQYNGIRRKLLFKTIIKYLELLEINKTSSIITRRNKFLKKLNLGYINDIFEYLFVDEFQDCTQSDYNIFYRLIKNPNNLVIAGDYAQAVHLGKNADIPRDNDETSERMKNRNYIKLEGSYRLPYRISEAIKPISEKIKSNGQEDTDIITPYKGAPPGARPIFVYADNDKQMAEKIISITKTYENYDVVDFNSEINRRIAILEKDFELSRELNILIPNIAETDTILRLKGMEKTCVLWSTKVKIIDADEINNFVYTILTRTSGLLIIAIYSTIKSEYVEILKQFRNDRVLIWDKATKYFINNNYSKNN
jgi:superfamily I DNA/RNA helicase